MLQLSLKTFFIARNNPDAGFRYPAWRNVKFMVQL